MERRARLRRHGDDPTALIAPLYEGKSSHEIFAAFLGRGGEGTYDIVRNYWKAQKATGDFEIFWRTALHDGVVVGDYISAEGCEAQSACSILMCAASLKPDARHPET